VIAIVVFLGIGSFFMARDAGKSISFSDRIGVLELDGVITDEQGSPLRTSDLVKTLDVWRKDSGMKGLVVHINSPGGQVGATQELVDAIARWRRANGYPVVASLGDIAASGGYYSAVACDEIVSNPGTLTGSIGVILTIANYQGLQEKIGVRLKSLKSGEFKDIGSGSRPMTDAERALLQATLDDIHGQFIDAVVAGRRNAVRSVLAERLNKQVSEITNDEVEKHIRSLADGRIFSGQQAFEEGMVDELGTFRDAVDRVRVLAHIRGEPRLVSSRQPRGLMELLNAQTRGIIGQMIPGQIAVEYRMAAP